MSNLQTRRSTPSGRWNIQENRFQNPQPAYQGIMLIDLAQRQIITIPKILVNIVSFGKIARDVETISWPPKHEIEMSISYLRNASGQIDSIFMIYSAPNQL